MKHFKLRHLLWLFFIHLYISAFTFGGGYVVIPMVRRFFVQQKKLFTEEELMDMAAVSQTSPGAIAINLSVLAGYRTAGIPGVVVAGIGSLLPPLVILSLVTLCYESFRDNRLVAAALKGMEAGAAALVVDVVLDLLQAVGREKHLLLTLAVPITFGSVFFLNIGALWLIGAAILTGLAEGALSHFYRQKEADNHDC